MEESLASQCPICEANFPMRGALKNHIYRKHPEHATPAHGTTARYRQQCRCERCREANTVAMRKRVEQEKDTLRYCLFESGQKAGISPDTILTALLSHSSYDLHWAAYRERGDFRLECKCTEPDEVLDSLEAS